MWRDPRPAPNAALKATLVTNNRKHFQKVKALKVENWVDETPSA
jgi:hypothetical protein